ncbi:Ger(x)C family spore germination protein [Salibacterium qingdaonense]|uniref:Spore germination protein KC n=1 Tax=Salibacterium qingdaonense TaxID=266892 RepID=A0A1I4KJ91_9BACI|nr:Ger(x)C family spore germination protein [Salibacterium qingdaonense]SFL78870.1 spore germination protein KC [Salibacterium qingdaonense]
MKIKLYCLTSALVGIILLSGCWSNQELPDLALVSAIGIDLEKDGRYTFTVQVINPGNVAGEGMQGTGGSESPPVSTYTESGWNLTEINRKLSKKVSRHIYFAHTNLVVISEKLAQEEGIMPVLDVLERDHEFRSSAQIVISHQSDAEDIMKTLSSIDKVPANKIINTMKSTEKVWGEHVSVSVRELIAKLVSPGEAPVVTTFHTIENQGETLQSIQRTNPDGRLEAAGLAIFKKGKMVDMTTGEISKGIVWLLNKVKNTAVSVQWEGEKHAAVFDLIRQQTKVSADVEKGGTVRMKVNVAAEGNVSEVQHPINLASPQALNKMEQRVEETIKQSIMHAVDKAQELETDILGFGEAVHREDPEKWKKWEDEWEESYFPEVQVDVSADVFIRRTGLRDEPFHRYLTK